MAKADQRILVSGASGLIGTALRESTRSTGVQMDTLVRHRRDITAGAHYWDPRKLHNAAHPVELEGWDAVIHLSGANVGRRWTAKYKQEIVSSRVATTQALCEAMIAAHRRPKVFICASGLGIYGDRGDEILTEASAPGSGFLADTCRLWEAAAEPASAAGIRVVHLRLAMVLSRKGGALGKMLPVFRLGLGGPMGSGDQWVSWITLRDVVRAIFFLIDRPDLSGCFNLAAPHPLTNRGFTRALGAALHRPTFLPVPAPALRLAFGEMANETVLMSQRAVPARLEAAGFHFEDEEAAPALKNLLA